jgi:hypothetical protein
MIKIKGENQSENLAFDHKSFESNGQMRSYWGILYTIGKIFSKAIKYFSHNLIKDLF